MTRGRFGVSAPDRKLGGIRRGHVPLLREKRAIHSFEGLVPARAWSREVQLAQAAAAQLAAFHEAAAQEALFQDAAAHDALFQDAAAQEALFHEAELHDALFHEAELHDALFHDALFQDASACAALAQLAESNERPPDPSAVTKAFSARFGLGGLATPLAALASTAPTPSARPAAEVCWALNMRAPLT